MGQIYFDIIRRKVMRKEQIKMIRMIKLMKILINLIWNQFLREIIRTLTERIRLNLKLLHFLFTMRKIQQKPIRLMRMTMMKLKLSLMKMKKILLNTMMKSTGKKLKKTKKKLNKTQMKIL